MLSLFIAFATGALFTAILAVVLGRRVVAQVNVPDVKVTLPDSLQVILQQPAPPPAPKDRATVWQEVYASTLDDLGYPSTSSDVNAALAVANQAVQIAFPNPR